MGTSIATTLWDRRASLHHAQLIEHITPYDPSSTHGLASLQTGGVDAPQSTALMNRLIDQQAFMPSANDIFLASALLFLVLIGVVWARPLRHRAAADAAAGAH